MTFDDQLRRTLDTMSDRLRAEVGRQVEMAVEEIAAAAMAEREQAVSDARDGAAREATGGLESAVAAARQEAREEGLSAGKDQGRREGLEEGLAAGKDQGRQEGRQEGLQEGLSAGKEMGHREGLEEGLAAGHEKGHRGGLEEGRQQGFDEGRQQGVLEGRRLAEAESRGTLDAAVASARAERTGYLRQYRAFGRIGAHNRWRAVARGDSGGAGQLRQPGIGACQRLDHSGRTAASLALDRHRRRRAVSSARRSWPDRRGGAHNAVATLDGTLAVPIAMAGQVVAVLFTNAGAKPGAIEILARYAARSLEALTAFKAARALTERPGELDADARARTGGDRLT